MENETVPQNTDITMQTPTNKDADTRQATPFRAFGTQEEFDNFCASIRKNAEERVKSSLKIKTDLGEVDLATYNEAYKKQIAPAIREEAVRQYKRELEMTENEKFEARKQEWEQQRKKEVTELNKMYANNLMKEAGFSDKRIEIELNSVTDDREASLSRITELCELYKTEKRDMEQSVMQQLQKNNPSVTMNNGEANPLQEKYDNAKAKGRIGEMIHYINEAKQKGIKIKQ